MHVSGARFLASVPLGLTILAEVGAIVLSWGLPGWYDRAFFAVYDVALATVGALIVYRLPRNPVGWFFCAGGLQGAVTSELAIGWGQRAVEEGWSGGQLAEWVGLVGWAPGALMWVLVLLYTPTGLLPGQGWRATVGAAIAGTCLYVVGWSLSPSSVNAITGEHNRFAVAGMGAQQLAIAGSALLCLSMTAAVASLIVRYRGADQVVRQQLKWVALAAGALAAFLPISIALWSVSPVVRALAPLVLAAMSMALAAAVLRYRLFDVDRIILRSAAYASATVLVFAVYATITISLGASIGRWSDWQVAAATLVAALVFRPAYRTARLLLDRRFDRDAHAARVRLDEFLDGLRSGTEQPDRIQEVLREALHDPDLTLLFYLPVTNTYADVRGRPARTDLDLATLCIERAGVPDVTVQYRDTGDRARRAPVQHLVEHARLALQIARLSVELTRQLDELDRSRARIAGAADEERRRIQRDLHDGAQQMLVTIGIGLRGVEGRLRKSGAEEDADKVDGLVADLAATIESLRRLADQLPPPQLDAGIAAAFQELAGRAPLPVVVEAPPERFDRSVEAIAYFVGCEGLTNVIKHAHATAVTMRAVRENGSLFVSVVDDGVGGARAGAGSGLRGLADRVTAAGGRLHIESGDGGTLLAAELPCG